MDQKNHKNSKKQYCVENANKQLGKIVKESGNHTKLLTRKECSLNTGYGNQVNSNIVLGVYQSHSTKELDEQLGRKFWRDYEGLRNHLKE